MWCHVTVIQVCDHRAVLFCHASAEHCSCHAFCMTHIEWLSSRVPVDLHMTLTSTSNTMSTAITTAITTTTSAPSTMTTTGPSDPTAVGAWASLGCYTDSVTARTFGMRLFPSEATIEGCTAACFALDYTLGGVVYADECCKFFFLFCSFIHD